LHIAAIVLLTILIGVVSAHLANYYWAQEHNAAIGSNPKRAPEWDSSDHMLQMQQHIDQLFAEASCQLAADPAAARRSISPGGASALRDPFRQMQRIQQEIDRMFNQTFRDVGHFGSAAAFDNGWNAMAVMPAMDLREITNTYVITAQLPDLEKSDIHISLTGPVLNILADHTARGTSEGGAGTTMTQQRQRFERHVRLPAVPAHPGDIVATFENGILRIAVPKASAVPPLEKEVPLR
jgi:HSP20 family protein